jgi:hypothetical protein
MASDNPDSTAGDSAKSALPVAARGVDSAGSATERSEGSNEINASGNLNSNSQQTNVNAEMTRIRSLLQSDGNAESKPGSIELDSAAADSRSLSESPPASTDSSSSNPSADHKIPSSTDSQKNNNPPRSLQYGTQSTVTTGNTGNTNTNTNTNLVGVEQLTVAPFFGQPRGAELVKWVNGNLYSLTTGRPASESASAINAGQAITLADGSVLPALYDANPTYQLDAETYAMAKNRCYKHMMEANQYPMCAQNKRDDSKLKR